MKTILKNIVALTAGLLMSCSTMAQQKHDHGPLAGHLSFKQDTLHFHASFPTAPVVGQETLLVLEAKDAKTHQTIAVNDKIEVVLWMTAMGHGSAPTKVSPAVDSQGNVVPGVFNVTNVYFIMGGDWDVQVSLTDAQGVKETNSFKVTLGGGHHHP